MYPGAGAKFHATPCIATSFTGNVIQCFVMLPCNSFLVRIHGSSSSKSRHEGIDTYGDVYSLSIVHSKLSAWKDCYRKEQRDFIFRRIACLVWSLPIPWVRCRLWTPELIYPKCISYSLSISSSLYATGNTKSTARELLTSPTKFFLALSLICMNCLA